MAAEGKNVGNKGITNQEKTFVIHKQRICICNIQEAINQKEKFTRKMGNVNRQFTERKL